MTLKRTALAGMAILATVPFLAHNADAEPGRVSALFVIFPSAHPQEDLFDCGNGWAEDSYTSLANGGAHVVCVKLNHGETRDGYYARRNGAK
jgi:hypothetical protein